MDKTVIALLSGASALAMVGGAQASAIGAEGDANGGQPARSFAELLDPIPNASTLLKAADERTGEIDSKPVELAQYYHHHHHHHHHHYRHHHHHHHHHYRHHHHHHHHHYPVMMIPLPGVSG